MMSVTKISSKDRKNCNVLNDQHVECKFNEFTKNCIKLSVAERVKFVTALSREHLDRLLKMDLSMLRYVKNPPEEVQLEAVERDGYAIQCIKKPSERVQLAAVKQNGRAIQHIKNPSAQVKLEAVKQSGNAIYYIDNPSKQVQLAAVQQDVHAIEYIKKPHESVKKYCGISSEKELL